MGLNIFEHDTGLPWEALEFSVTLIQIVLYFLKVENKLNRNLSHRICLWLSLYYVLRTLQRYLPCGLQVSMDTHTGPYIVTLNESDRKCVNGAEDSPWPEAVKINVLGPSHRIFAVEFFLQKMGTNYPLQHMSLVALWGA